MSIKEFVSDLHNADVFLSIEETPFAYNQFGIRYFIGRGVDQDAKKALCCFLRSAHDGCPQGMFNLAMMYWFVFKKGKYVYPWLLKAAKGGVGWAQYLMGVCEEVETGMAGVKDSKLITDEALNWYEKGALSGNLYSLLAVAIANERGHGPIAAVRHTENDGFGVSTWFDHAIRDPVRAAKCYQRVYDLGLKWDGIRIKLAQLYETGEGVEKNEALACQTYDDYVVKHMASLKAGPSNCGAKLEMESICLHKLDPSQRETVHVDQMRPEWSYVIQDDWWLGCARTVIGDLCDDLLVPVTVIDTIVEHFSWLPCVWDAFANLVKMRQEGRGLAIPQAHEDFCEDWLSYVEYGGRTQRSGCNKGF